jgi:hypothetical protein
MRSIKDIERRVQSFEKIYPSQTNVISLCKRLIASNPFDNVDDLWTAIYYLTDEDYINERHAIIFFVERMV